MYSCSLEPRPRSSQSTYALTVTTKMAVQPTGGRNVPQHHRWFHPQIEAVNQICTNYKLKSTPIFAENTENFSHDCNPPTVEDFQV